jgi:hypothetical protein
VVDGRVTVARDGAEWQFVPSRSWTAGRHVLVVSSILEDPSGNRINHPFEMDPASARATEPDEYRVPFDIRSN